MRIHFLYLVLFELAIMTRSSMVLAGQSSQAVLELITQKTEFWDDTRCTLATFDVDPTFLADLMESVNGTSPVVHISSHENGHSLPVGIWCVVVIASVGTNSRGIEGVTRGIPKRRVIFLSSSPKDTDDINITTMTIPSAIIEHIPRTETNLVTNSLTFRIHIICPECMVPFHYMVDKWIGGHGFVHPVTNYFVIGVTPYIIFDAQTGHLGGIDIDLLRIVAQKFQFKPNIRPEKTWGAVIDGKWIGTVGSVQQGASSLGIGHVSITSDRYQIIDYTEPTYFVEYAQLSPKPKVLNKYANIVAPFSPLVWLCLVGCVAAMGLTMFIHLKGYDQMPFFATLIRKPQSAIDYMIIPMSMLVTQERMNWFHQLDRSSSGALLVLVWSMCALTLNLAYLSNLRASLIAVAYEKPIDTDQQIVEKGDPVYFIRGTSLIDGLKTSPLTVHNQLYDLATKKNSFYDFDGGIPWVALDPVAASGTGFVLTSRHAYDNAKSLFVQRYGDDPFHIAKENTLTVYAGFVIPKNVLWKNKLNHLIQTLTERGITLHLFGNSVPLRFENEKKGQTIKFPESPKALEIQTIVTPMAALAVAHFMSLLIFWAEMRFARPKETRVSHGSPACLRGNQPKQSYLVQYGHLERTSR
ncbi:hypothetical protein TCAL_00277 [Tigriopus californicus]|uniref:Ionotropic glutamate receptor L-glutamate and glycine-binding domain-containing protein n=1 Tax=Tigriopus californicus TaxID=6832 RepID=A0A553P364_TIGCA|nr:hypothetical protein TCAL_00277 [Tigriopus californicus]|eukprot:TCALIF_00277-PA protein Name:"Similar to Glutamate receptor (Lymnaea stagnalis)" AED:0.34 eAED:0.34 QI:0/0/0/0.25/1/1/4/0/637